MFYEAFAHFLVSFIPEPRGIPTLPNEHSHSITLNILNKLVRILDSISKSEMGTNDMQLNK